VSAAAVTLVAHVACAAPLAYSAKGAADASGLGLTAIRGALNDGSLPKHYLNTKIVILASDLLAWLTNLPTTSASTDG
jgi:hypothetical protein